MGKFWETLHAAPLVCVALCSLLLGAGCTSNKAGIGTTELPARHWLDDAPGIPVENKQKYDAAVPSLYTPGKQFSFEDCVYLTIQQSPVLVNSAVNIEIKRLAQTDAIWKYLPEPRMTFTVSQNITRYNNDARDIDGEYGQPQYEIGFYAPFPNPVSTYFETKAQGMMVNVAISTHRKAVGEAIYKIGEAYIRLQAQQYILQATKSLVPVARELTEFWREVVKVEGNQGSAVSMAQQREREAELAVEKETMEETMQRTELKILAGVEPQQTFNVDASHADDLLRGFDGKKMSWERQWDDSEDSLILRTQLKLADYNIMLAWAQYVPNMSFSVNMTPGRGQSQPASGTADQFLHFTFDFPLIDWGRRYRGIQTARMGKAQAFHQMAEKRFSFQNTWLQAEQQVSLAFTKLKLAQNRYKTAQMQYEEARIGFESGVEQLPVVAERQQSMVDAQIGYINAERDFRLAQLNWMYVSGALQKRFLGLPSKELDKVSQRGPRGLRKGIVQDTASTPVRQAPEQNPAEQPVFVPARSAETPPAPAVPPSHAVAGKRNARPIGHVTPEKIPNLPDTNLVTTPTK